MNRVRKCYIHSAHRSRGTPSNFMIELGQDIQCEGEVHCAISSVSFPHVLYGIQEGVNNKLYIRQVSASTHENTTLDIASGNYSGSSLSNAISQKLSAAALSGISYSVNYAQTTQKISIVATGGTFGVYDDATLKGDGPIGAAPVANPQSLQEILNIPPHATASVSWTSNVIAMQRATEVYIRSPSLSNYGTLDSINRNDALKRVILNRDFGELVTTSDSLEPSDYFPVSNQTLRTLNFLVTDHYGNIVNLHSINISFVLNFIYGPLD